MSFWTLDNLAEVTGGRFLSRPEGVTLTGGVSTDSRAPQQGQVFLAIQGERFNGHDYLEQAAGNGAALLIVHDKGKAIDVHNTAVLLVDSTLTAMARLAQAYRQTLSGTVIAITGSAGKTTTKQMIDAVLSRQFKGRAAEKSFNNHIGVPLTLLNAPADSQYVVVEIGTNAPGEVAELAAITQPDTAVITLIGHSHLEGLGSIEGVAKEKASLLDHVSAPGRIIVNGDTALLEPYLADRPNITRFGKGPTCDPQLTDYRPTDSGAAFKVNNETPFDLPMPGEHNALNALAAIGVGRAMGLSDDQIAAGLRQAQSADMRMNLEQIGGVTLINDAYNANPESMAAAIEVLANRPCEGRRIAVLGDMLELGEHGTAAHRAVIDRLNDSKIDAAILIGPLMTRAAKDTPTQDRGITFDPHDRLDDHAIAAAVSWVSPGDAVLIKGSRGMGLERCADAIRERFGAE